MDSTSARCCWMQLQAVRAAAEYMEPVSSTSIPGSATDGMSAGASQTAFEFSDSDRLGLAVFISILVHMIVILGVTFSASGVRMPGLDTLEITLVQTHSGVAPKHPDFLAQANQNGGGNSRQHKIARTPLPAMDLSDRNNRLPVAHPNPQTPLPRMQQLASLLTDADAGFHITSPRPQPPERHRQTGHASAGLTALARLQRESAHLNAEISRSWQKYEKLPRQKYIDARTLKYKYAAYKEAWCAKVERIGNLNYPSKAIQRNISGSVVLDVAIRADGSLYRVKVLRSSGYKVLDDAAVRIARLAAPYAPFPPNIRATTDILHIIRTWQFTNSSVTTTGS